MTTKPKYVFAQGETFEQMRENFLASADGQALYRLGDVKLVWVNEGDLYEWGYPWPPAAE